MRSAPITLTVDPGIALIAARALLDAGRHATDPRTAEGLLRLVEQLTANVTPGTS